jgi:hypothetical protein
MSKEKKFKLSKDEIKELVTGVGGCLATDRITVDGELVDYMYREESSFDVDSGWRFFSGTEDQEYIDNPDNSAVYDINTIANYDKAIIPYLHLPTGTQLERIRGTDNFQIIPG